MELYPWVRALIRFAANLREALTAIMTILDSVDLLILRLLAFAGLYFVYVVVKTHLKSP